MINDTVIESSEPSPQQESGDASKLIQHFRYSYRKMEDHEFPVIRLTNI